MFLEIHFQARSAPFRAAAFQRANIMTNISANSTVSMIAIADDDSLYEILPYAWEKLF